MLNVDVIVCEDVLEEFPLDTGRLSDYVADVLDAKGVSEGEVNVVFVDDGYMTELNGRYRKREGTTDVLSFRLSDDDSGRLEGEVYVSVERAEKQAGEYGVPLPEELVRLVTHGVLHLTGMVHDTDDEYASMTGETERFVGMFFGRESR